MFAKLLSLLLLPNLFPLAGQVVTDPDEVQRILNRPILRSEIYIQYQPPVGFDLAYYAGPNFQYYAPSDEHLYSGWTNLIHIGLYKANLVPISMTSWYKNTLRRYEKHCRTLDTQHVSSSDIQISHFTVCGHPNWPSAADDWRYRLPDGGGKSKIEIALHRVLTYQGEIFRVTRYWHGSEQEADALLAERKRLIAGWSAELDLLEFCEVDDLSSGCPNLVGPLDSGWLKDVLQQGIDSAPPSKDCYSEAAVFLANPVEVGADDANLFEQSKVLFAGDYDFEKFGEVLSASSDAIKAYQTGAPGSVIILPGQSETSAHLSGKNSCRRFKTAKREAVANFLFQMEGYVQSILQKGVPANTTARFLTDP